MSLEQLVTVAQSQGTGSEAFSEICRRFTGLVKKYANQPHVAGIKEEAAAEGWLAVATAVRSFDPSGGVHFAGYVESKVRYAVWNLFKRERRCWQQEVPLTGSSSEGDEAVPGYLDTLPAAQQVEAEVEAGWLAAELRQALDALPDKQRIAIVRTIVGHARLADVAAEQGISPQAVYSLRQRGLERLRKQLLKNLF